MNFESKYTEIGKVELPEFSGIRILGMPVVYGDTATIPLSDEWKDAINRSWNLFDYLHGTYNQGEICYLTIDEKVVKAGTSQRREGKHVDGAHGSAWGCGGGGSGSAWGCNGLLLISNPSGCRAWQGEFEGEPMEDGDCDHLDFAGKSASVLEANRLYLLNSHCIHESMLMTEDTKRTMVRISLPSNSPWYSYTTPNPLGIKPRVPILDLPMPK